MTAISSRTSSKQASPVLGVDPAPADPRKRRARRCADLKTFFNAGVAERLAEGNKADVILANNVLAHVDGINAFVEDSRFSSKRTVSPSSSFPI